MYHLAGRIRKQHQTVDDLVGKLFIGVAVHTIVFSVMLTVAPYVKAFAAGSILARLCMPWVTPVSKLLQVMEE